MSAERWALAVLDKFLTPHERDDLREARAAVAELIERERKAREALRYVMACVGNSGMVEHAAREAAEAVLAEGGAA